MIGPKKTTHEPIIYALYEDDNIVVEEETVEKFVNVEFIVKALYLYKHKKEIEPELLKEVIEKITRYMPESMEIIDEREVYLAQYLSNGNNYSVTKNGVKIYNVYENEYERLEGYIRPMSSLFSFIINGIIVRTH
jgi:hypothetical protein